MPHTAPKLFVVAAALSVGVGCARKIDRFTLDKVVVTGLQVGDTHKACALGESLAHPLAAVPKNEPHKAMLIAEGNAALCLEKAAWEADLDAARAKANLRQIGPPVAAEITDAALRAERAHALAAARFERSFAHAEATFGPYGDGDCPKIKEKDEFAYLFALVTGTLALIHDRKAGGVNDIPLDRLLAIARATECIDSAKWWSVPEVIQNGAWATIPGSAPEGVDPWAELDTAAATGETSGVRVGRAMQILIAANAGADDRAADALRAMATSLEQTPRDPAWALLDQYAYEVALHESDLAWTIEEGHRTPVLGEWPGDDAAETLDDPFAEDDPFGAPFGGDDAPTDEGSETPDEPGDDEPPPETDDTEETP